jgi:putative ATP-grasp target RiPP
MRLQTIWRPRNLFPLIREVHSATLQTGSENQSCRPFGLRYVAEPRLSATADADLAMMRLDEVTQIAVMSDDGMPAFKHTSGKTKTTTNVDDRNASDDDADFEQD